MCHWFLWFIHNIHNITLRFLDPYNTCITHKLHFLTDNYIQTVKTLIYNIHPVFIHGLFGLFTPPRLPSPRLLQNASNTGPLTTLTLMLPLTLGVNGPLDLSSTDSVGHNATKLLLLKLLFYTSISLIKALFSAICNDHNFLCWTCNNRFIFR